MHIGFCTGLGYGPILRSLYGIHAFSAYQKFGWFYKLEGVLFVGVLVLSCNLLFGVYIRAPDVWKLRYRPQLILCPPQQPLSADRGLVSQEAPRALGSSSSALSWSGYQWNRRSTVTASTFTCYGPIFLESRRHPRWPRYVPIL